MAEQSPSLSSQLKAVARGPEAINFDVNTILPILQLNEILNKNEVDIIKNKIMQSERVVALFVDILPTKNMETIAKMYLILKEDKGSSLWKLLEEKLGVFHEFRALIQSPEVTHKLLANQKFQDSVFLRLKEELTKLFNSNIFDIQPFPTLRDFSIPIDDMWDLQIQESNIKTWRLVAQKEFPSLFQERLKKPVLVLGKPGIGKSTLWKKMCREWAKGSFFTEFHLILPCKLRDIGECDTILELALSWLEQVLPDNRCVDDFRKGDLLNNLNILVMLDGMNEYSGPCKELDLLFEKTKLLGFSLLITSRPMEIQFGEVGWCFLKIARLKLENIQRYIDTIFKFLKEKDHDLYNGGASRVLEAIQLRPNLRELARIPVILTCLCVEPATIKADTSAKRYTELLKFLVARHNTNKLLQETFDLSDNRLRELGKLALYQLLANFEHLEQLGIEQPDWIPYFLDVGFLARKISPEPQEMAKVNFLHKTIKEFFAAVYIGLAIKERHRSYFNSLWNDLRVRRNHWNIMSGLIGFSEEWVPEIEFLTRLEEPMRIFIGITSEPEYPHPINARKFLKAYLASADVPPSVLTSYLKESKSDAFSEIITSHLDKRDITFKGPPSKMAIFIQDAPNLNIPSFKWIINECFATDLLSFEPKDATKLKIKHFEVQIDVESFGSPKLQQFLADFVKKYLHQSIVAEEVKISLDSQTTLDIHLYKEFSALSRSGSCNVNVGLENICDHSLKGTFVFLKNLKPSKSLSSLVLNIDDCVDVDTKLLNVETAKAPLSLEHLHFQFISKTLNPSAQLHVRKLIDVTSRLLHYKRLRLSSVQRTTIDTNIFVEIFKLAKGCLEVKFENICIIKSPIKVETSFYEGTKFDALRITNIFEADIPVLCLTSENSEILLRIKFNDESAWNSLSSFAETIMQKPITLYFGYSSFCIAMHEQPTLCNFLKWVWSDQQKFTGLMTRDTQMMRFYKKWMRNNLQRKEEYQKWLRKDPQKRRGYLEWMKNYSHKKQNYKNWVRNDTQRMQLLLEAITTDPGIRVEFLEWMMHDDPCRMEEFLKWMTNEPSSKTYSRRIQLLMEWMRKTPLRKNYLERMTKAQFKIQCLIQWIKNDPLKMQDFLEWIMCEPLRMQDLIEWMRDEQRSIQDFLEWMGNDSWKMHNFMEWMRDDRQRIEDFYEWMRSDQGTKEEFQEWMRNNPQTVRNFIEWVKNSKQTTHTNRDNLPMLQNQKFWKALSIFVHRRSTQQLIIDIRLPKEEIANAIAFMKQLITDITPSLKESGFRCTLKGETFQNPELILEQWSYLGSLDFILIINNSSLHSEAVLHVLSP